MNRRRVLAKCGCEALRADTVPVLRETAYGEWLATTPQSCDARIGVIADTEEGARIMFAKSTQRWLELLETGTLRATELGQITQRA